MGSGATLQWCCESSHNRILLKAALLSTLCCVSLCFFFLPSLWAPQGLEVVAVTPGEAGGAFSGFGSPLHIMLLFTIHNIALTYSHCNISALASCPSLYLFLWSCMYPLHHTTCVWWRLWSLYAVTPNSDFITVNTTDFNHSRNTSHLLSNLVVWGINH